MQISSRHHEWASLLKDIHEDVIHLLSVRYIFRTIQEIGRRNKGLHSISSTFSIWTMVVYGVTNSVGIRRLAGQSYKQDDVNFVRLLDMILPHASELFDAFQRHFPDDLAESQNKLLNQVRHIELQQMNACKRLIGKDRQLLLSVAQKAIDFASKRAAHHNASVTVNTNFFDLDTATDTVKSLTEKYLLLVDDQKHDLHQEMKLCKLGQGWDKIFLEAWATPATLELPLGEMTPPEKPPR